MIRIALMEMTWKQFRDMVDEQLAAQGIGEDTPIWYIDISFPREEDFAKGRLAVYGGEGGLVIE